MGPAASPPRLPPPPPSHPRMSAQECPARGCPPRPLQPNLAPSFLFSTIRWEKRLHARTLAQPCSLAREERARVGVSPGEVQGTEVVRKAGLKSWPGRPFAGRIQTDDSASLSLSFLLHQIGLKCQPTWAVVWTQGVRGASPGVQHAAGAH